MTIRPIDENGDMMPVTSLDDLISETPAVAQVIRHRTNMHFGEWWEDETLGFKVPRFLLDGVRSGNVGMLSQYISKFISETPGVATVAAADVTYENHKMTYRTAVRTIYGDATALEVDLDGLL